MNHEHSFKKISKICSSLVMASIFTFSQIFLGSSIAFAEHEVSSLPSAATTPTLSLDQAQQRSQDLQTASSQIPADETTVFMASSIALSASSNPGSEHVMTLRDGTTVSYFNKYTVPGKWTEFFDNQNRLVLRAFDAAVIPSEDQLHYEYFGNSLTQVTGYRSGGKKDTVNYFQDASGRTVKTVFTAYAADGSVSSTSEKSYPAIDKTGLERRNNTDGSTVYVNSYNQEVIRENADGSRVEKVYQLVDDINAEGTDWITKSLLFSSTQYTNGKISRVDIYDASRQNIKYTYLYNPDGSFKETRIPVDGGAVSYQTYLDALQLENISQMPDFLKTKNEPQVLAEYPIAISDETNVKFYSDSSYEFTYKAVKYKSDSTGAVTLSDGTVLKITQEANNKIKMTNNFSNVTNELTLEVVNGTARVQSWIQDGKLPDHPANTITFDHENHMIEWKEVYTKQDGSVTTETLRYYLASTVDLNHYVLLGKSQDNEASLMLMRSPGRDPLYVKFDYVNGNLKLINFRENQSESFAVLANGSLDLTENAVKQITNRSVANIKSASGNDYILRDSVNVSGGFGSDTAQVLVNGFNFSNPWYDTSFSQDGAGKMTVTTVLKSDPTQTKVYEVKINKENAITLTAALSVTDLKNEMNQIAAFTDEFNRNYDDYKGTATRDLMAAKGAEFKALKTKAETAGFTSFTAELTGLLHFTSFLETEGAFVAEIETDPSRVATITAEEVQAHLQQALSEIAKIKTELSAQLTSKILSDIQSILIKAEAEERYYANLLG